MESEKSIQIHKKIAEVKKRILLAEGQKKANAEEWEKKKTANAETITNLKKEIKEFTEKLKQIKNPVPRRPVKDYSIVAWEGKPIYPIGAKNAAEAYTVMDLRAIDTQKQYDLLHSKYIRRQQYFNKLVCQYQELLAYKDSSQNQNIVFGPPPETLEEDSNRKRVAHLENEIHRTNVQWLEAEHIRKKYIAIKASLLNDAEHFEKSLKELEQSLSDQQAEINRLQQVHKDAIEMRDGAKIILQRQEQQAHSSNKARERQALEFRKQVEQRKMELERIERTLFATGSSKTLGHQESVGSSVGDQLTGKTDQQEDENKDVAAEMDTIFKKFMEITGATSPQEVLQRFIAQKESTTRLTYLRTAAEAEKKHLENQREMLTTELEASKFSDLKENEENQELLESIKSEIEKRKNEKQNNLDEIEKTQKVIKSIKDTLNEMIFKLQEVDETDITLMKTNTIILAQNLPDFLKNDAIPSDLIDILEEKITRVLRLTPDKQTEKMKSEEEESDDIKVDDLYVQLASPRAPSVLDEKPQPLPMCYYNLIIGRTGQSVSASPGPAPPPAAADDENEVPSRNYLKKQAILIVDSKSRRKGFRPAAQRRK